MQGILDIAPLRSFLAVADCGGFQRAASVLHLSQAGVSQHVRRLESAVGRPLVERHGRGFRFTADGEQLLSYARRILELHDEALGSFAVKVKDRVVIGSTEHGAAQLLPELAAELDGALPDHQVRFRIDRGTKLREGLSAGRLDLALLIGPAEGPRATPVGSLELNWYAAPGWKRHRSTDPVPLIAFDDPCALRTRALETLAQHGIPATIGAEAAQLAGVQAAVGAGLGVALMATLGQTPDGLVVVDDLPVPVPLDLAIWSRGGIDVEVTRRTAQALRTRLVSVPGEPNASRGLELVKGA
jgi:DNA-binding transcriptional LysR family regulator